VRSARALGICAAIAVGASLGTFAPAAMAAPPNDLFANREAMPSMLPSAAEGSNIGATAEAGEYLSGTGHDAHHSVWWSWEAPTTQVVSIGTCGTEFRTTLGIFTGEAFSELHRVGSEDAIEGHDCASRLSFQATAGRRYDIGVDGDFFYPDPTVHLSGEGRIKLQVTATPTPTNDAFETPGPWSIDEISEYPDGTHRRLLMAAEGSNFAATRQPGEPNFGGAGASVWYGWTPSESGPVEVLLGTNTSPSRAALAVYSGNSLTGLTLVDSKVEPLITAVSFAAEAGREYRIVVDGMAEPDGAPWMGNFFLHLIEALPDRPRASTAAALPAPLAPLSAPRISRRKIDSKARSATFRFRASAPGATFRCRLDTKPFRACSSPYLVRGLALGRHRFAVRATAPGSSASAAAVAHFALRPR
jgi:hypothetical protein